MAKKKKNLLAISNKIKFRKPSKQLSNKPVGHLTYSKTVPQLSNYVIQSASSGLITRNQLEAVRVAIKRRVKQWRGKVWVLLYPDRIVTKRALETRMGRGKGAPNKQIALVAPGQLMYEISGPPMERMRIIFTKALQKLSVKSLLLSVDEREVLAPFIRQRKR